MAARKQSINIRDLLAESPVVSLSFNVGVEAYFGMMEEDGDVSFKDMAFGVVIQDVLRRRFGSSTESLFRRLEQVRPIISSSCSGRRSRRWEIDDPSSARGVPDIIMDYLGYVFRTHPHCAHWRLPRREVGGGTDVFNTRSRPASCVLNR